MVAARAVHGPSERRPPWPASRSAAPVRQQAFSKVGDDVDRWVDDAQDQRSEPVTAAARALAEDAGVLVDEMRSS